MTAMVWRVPPALRCRHLQAGLRSYVRTWIVATLRPPLYALNTNSCQSVSLLEGTTISTSTG